MVEYTDNTNILKTLKWMKDHLPSAMKHSCLTSLFWYIQTNDVHPQAKEMIRKFKASDMYNVIYKDLDKDTSIEGYTNQLTGIIATLMIVYKDSFVWAEYTGKQDDFEQYLLLASFKKKSDRYKEILGELK